MRKIQYLAFILCVCTHIFCAHDRFILMMPLYGENNQDRIQEYLFCLDKNLQNPAIEKVHIIFDALCEKCNFILLNELYKRPVIIDFIKGRVTYGYCFQLANRLYSDRKIILSNADIFFNETLNQIHSCDLSNRFLAITRWQYQINGSMAPYRTSKGEKIEFSQDTWIFRTPIKSFKNDRIELGTVGCDGKIAKQAFLSGFQVINPCLSIQCGHVHLTNIRHYPFTKQNKNELMAVPWSTWEEHLECLATASISWDDVSGCANLLLKSSKGHDCNYDVTQRLPLPDNSVDRYQSEDVFEHIDYEKLVDVINEIHRVLKPGALFRLSVPDYRCDLLYKRSVKDTAGNVIFDPCGGGKLEKGIVVGGGHVWFPIIENVSALLERTKFSTQGKIEYLHYYDVDGKSITHPIDYSLGHVKRTPDHDDRVKTPYRGMSIVVDLYKK